IRAGAAVADHVHAELAAGGFDGDVDLPGGHPDAFGDDFEVVDQRLHRGAHDAGDVGGRVAQPVGAQLQVGGPGDLLVVDHDRARSQSLQALRGDLDRLVHLLDPDHIASVGVGAGVGDHVEVVVLIAAVGLGLAQVVGKSGGAQDRAGDAQRDAAGQIQVADVLGAGLPDRVFGEQVFQI